MGTFIRLLPLGVSDTPSRTQSQWKLARPLLRLKGDTLMILCPWLI